MDGIQGFKCAGGAPWTRSLLPRRRAATLVRRRGAHRHTEACPSKVAAPFKNRTPALAAPRHGFQDVCFLAKCTSLFQPLELFPALGNITHICTFELLLQASRCPPGPISLARVFTARQVKLGARGHAALKNWEAPF